MSGMQVALVSAIGLVLIYDAYHVVAGNGAVAWRLEQHGIASWYGLEEQGRPTANGERFDRHAFTAASRHLPMDSVVRVTNQRNGRSVEVRINDRGPWVHGRILDLSEAAADTLDMKKSGTAPVTIEVVAPPSAQTAAP
ncbi:MAG: septal ring lytic transglycosylase RlpA family protein [Verrucomicrobiota bacterium]